MTNSDMTIAVNGATGFTGRLVADELARRSIDAVLIGRDPERLDAVGGPDADRRVADIDEPDTLITAFAGCDAVVNCAGPFALLGEPVVRAAIDAGVHYMDVSGELPYIMRVFDDYAGRAERAGVTVVPMVNDGGFVADLLTSVIAARLDSPDTVVLVHAAFGDGGLSRGSGRSAVLARDTLTGDALVYADGRWSNQPAIRTEFTLPGATVPTTVAKGGWPEIATIPRHVRARRVEGVGDAAFLNLFASMTEEMVDSLPDSLTEEQRSAVRFTIVAEVSGESGTIRGVVDGCDTYGTTAIIAVEAARRLIADGAAPGVLAPAQAFTATDFLDSLAPHGVGYSIGTVVDRR